MLSIVGQDYPHARAVILLQNFTRIQEEHLRGLALSVFRVAEAGRPKPLVLNVEGDEEDMRSRLLTEGLQIEGRFASFLDFDDYYYPFACSYFAYRLEESGAALTFARTVGKRVFPTGPVDYTLDREVMFASQSGLGELFKTNFCPINSFALDLSRISADDLYFDHSISRLEDYEFLLRICSKYQSDFDGLTRAVSVYAQRIDASGSTNFAGGGLNTKHEIEWDKGRAKIEALKRRLLSEPNKFTPYISKIIRESMAATSQ
ncbi:MAG: hypothetical protein SGJ17_11600 [Hyphomicrobiales bacterium]|nr:hypothetical protein [Hyphomicrobiales bacterium]